MSGKKGHLKSECWFNNNRHGNDKKKMPKSINNQSYIESNSDDDKFSVLR